MAVSDDNIAADNFWLNIAAESIYNTFEKRSKAVEQLIQLILWAFGTLSIGGIFSIFGIVKDMDSETISKLGISYYLLIFAYVLASLARFPVKVNFNPLNILEIQSVYKKAVKIQTYFFSVAAIITIFGFIFFANAVLNEFHSINEKKFVKKTDINQSIDSTISVKIIANIRFLSDTAYLPIVVDTKKSMLFDLTVSLDTLKYSYLLKKVFLTDNNGKFYNTMILPADSKYVVIKATIRDLKNGRNYSEKSEIRTILIKK